MSDTMPKPQPDVWPPIGCEVQDFVIGQDGYCVERMQNRAANDELLRRGGGSDRWGAIVPSGEVAPYAIEWVSTCGGSEVQLPDVPFVGMYGAGYYGMGVYGGVQV